MVNKELKKASRRDLIDIIYQMKKKEAKMEEELTSLKKEMEAKRIRLSQAGSVAEAAISITDVFSAAQAAADLYLHEISCMKEDAEKEAAEIVNRANKIALKVLAETKEQHAVMLEYYQADYEKWKKLREEIDTLKMKNKRDEHKDLEYDSEI